MLQVDLITTQILYFYSSLWQLIDVRTGWWVPWHNHVSRFPWQQHIVTTGHGETPPIVEELYMWSWRKEFCLSSAKRCLISRLLWMVLDAQGPGGERHNFQVTSINERAIIAKYSLFNCTPVQLNTVFSPVLHLTLSNLRPFKVAGNN